LENFHWKLSFQPVTFVSDPEFMPIRLAIVIFLSLLLVNLKMLAQNDHLNRKTWSDSPLEWEDFKLPAYINQEIFSEFVYHLGFRQARVRERDSVMIFFQAEGYMDKNASWVLPTAKSSLLLHFNQALFNYLELQRRELQESLYLVPNLYFADQKFRQAQIDLRQKIEEIKNQTAFGRDAKAVDYYLETSRELLEPQPNPFLFYRQSRIGYGLHFGAGSSLLGGEFTEYLVQPINLLFGFDLSYQELFLFVDGTIGWTKMEHAYQEADYWPEGLTTGLAVINFGAGTPLINSGKIKLMPFIGWGLVELSSQDKDQQYETNRMLDHSLMLGLNLDYHLRKLFNLVPGAFFSNKEYVETNLRMRVFYSSANYRHDFSGSLVNISLGLGFYSRMLVEIEG
jgi:hypothetical protein